MWYKIPIVKRIYQIMFSIALFAFAAFGQTATPIITLPTAVSVVGEFNQLSTPQWAIGLSALYTTSPQASISMYNKIALFAFAAFGQTATPIITLPTAVSVVGEFNQLSTPQWAIGRVMMGVAV